MTKKIISLLLAIIMILSLSACSPADLKEKLEDFVSEYGEKVDNKNNNDENVLFDDEDNSLNTDIDTNTESSANEPSKVISCEALTHSDMEKYEDIKNNSVFSEYKPFHVYISKDNITEYFVTPITYTTFDDNSDGILTKTKLPNTLDAGEIVPLEAEIFGQKIKTKLINFYYDKKQNGDEATLCYYESKIDDGCQYSFPFGLTHESTKDEFIKTLGENDYGNASLKEDILCYDVPDGDLNNYNAFLELTFDIETQKLVSFRYGLFVPEYLQEKISE